MFKLINTAIILTALFFCSATKAFSVAVIDAEKNAYRHNNKGIIFLNEKYYYGAIKEFEIAIALVPDKQASSVFYTNLAKTYDKIGHHELAEPMYEKALKYNCLNTEYYVNLAASYKISNKLDEKIKLYKSKNDSPLNEVMLGVLYIQKGDVLTGITMLDNFCDKEPNLKITPGVKRYIEKTVKEKL